MTTSPAGSWTSALARLVTDPQSQDAEAQLPTRPAALEYLGHAVAERIGADTVDLVATWDTVDDAALGHVVARELEVDHILVYEPREGELCFDVTPAPGARLALVGVTFRGMYSVRGPLTLAASRGAELAAVVTLTPSPVIDSELDDPSRLLTLTPH